MAAVLILVGCGDLDRGALSGSSSSASPAPTPTPDIAQRLMARVRQMTAVVRRIDRIEAVPAKWGDVQARSGLQVSGADRTEDVWVVAVVGEIASGGGVYPCGRWVHDQAGLIKSSGAGSLKTCAPYFRDSLVPPSAPIACGPEPSGYRYPGGSPTRPGPVPLTIARDDRWALPALAPGLFLYEVPEGSGGYYETYCRAENIVTVSGQRDNMLLGLGSPRVTGPVPQGQAQLWLKNFHALEATAGTSVVRVVIEPRNGFEIASFDWRVVAPEGGYVTFEFVDRAGREVIPFRVANGP